MKADTRGKRKDINTRRPDCDENERESASVIGRKHVLLLMTFERRSLQQNLDYVQSSRREVEFECNAVRFLFNLGEVYRNVG